MDAPWKLEDLDRGRRIRAERERIGWSRDRLADIAGTSRNTIESYELGRRFKNRGNAESLARALGWTYADLMGVSAEDAAKPVPKPAVSRSRYRAESPLTRGDLANVREDIAALHARYNEIAASYGQAQRDAFEQVAGRINDIQAAVTELREDLERLTSAQSTTGASLASLTAQVSALLAGQEDRSRSRTRVQSRSASRATGKKHPTG